MQLEALKNIDSELIKAIANAPGYPYFQPGTGHTYIFPESDETIKMKEDYMEEISIDPFGDHAAPPELQKELHKLLHPAYRYKPHIVLDELNLFRLNLPQYEIERAVDAKINPPTERK